MAMGIGYKLLRSDLTSISEEHGRVQYGSGWVKVPRKGAYIGLTLPGLLRGGLGEVLARVEYKSPTGAVDDGDVVTARRVRILRHAPVDLWALVRVAIWGARQVLPPKGHPLRAVCLRAVKAAERYEKKRTAAVEEADAERTAWAVEAAKRASARVERWVAETAEEAARWAAESAKRASVWAVEAAWRAAGAAARADWAADWAAEEAEWTSEAAEEASVWAEEAARWASWAAEAAADKSNGAALARRLLDQLVDEAFPSAPAAVV